MATIWDFTTNGVSVIKTLRDSDPPREQSFDALSLRMVDKLIYLYEAGLYASAIAFEQIGTIEGDTPSDLQDAYNLIEAIIPAGGVGTIPNLTQVLAQGNRQIKYTEDETYNTVAGDETKILISAGTVTFNIVNANHPVGSVIKIFGSDCYITSDIAINGIDGTIPRFIPTYTIVELLKFEEGSGWTLNYKPTNLTNTPKQFKGLITQSGTSNVITVSSGGITKGVTYFISHGGGDFTSFGAPNNDVGTFFICTQDGTPTWGTGGELTYDEGAPVVIYSANTLGNCWFSFISDGTYGFNSVELFNYPRTFLNQPYLYDFLGDIGYKIIYTDTSSIIINTYDGGTPTNGVFSTIYLDVEILD